VIPGGPRGCEVSRNTKSTKIYCGFLGNRFWSYDKAVSCYNVFGYRSHNYMAGRGGGERYRVVGTRITGRVGIPCWLSTAGLLLGFMLQYFVAVKWGKLGKNVACLTL
jgi:hypothetical protein